MGIRTYDPKKIISTFAGIPITGYADGSFVTASRDEDGWTKHVGAGGDVARARNNNKGGSATFTLMASTPVNDLLAAQAALDELSGNGSGALLIVDTNGTTLISAPNAWIKKNPQIEFAKEVGSREWVIDCDELEIFVGGTLSN